MALNFKSAIKILNLLATGKVTQRATLSFFQGFSIKGRKPSQKTYVGKNTA